ncbi:MAG: hypothetical protein KDK28_15115 [Maritimibacter sp.]|nr:hypothetical protein [Maritimibacter sp.]
MTFSFAEVGLPVAVLMALTVLVPVVVVPRAVMGQGRLALGMGLVALVVFVAAAGWFALFHWRAGDVFRWGAVLGPAAMSAFAWGPVWALVWLVRAQGVERRRGEAAARAGLDLGRED